jgi:hypothetical protein
VAGLEEDRTNELTALRVGLCDGRERRPFPNNRQNCIDLAMSAFCRVYSEGSKCCFNKLGAFVDFRGFSVEGKHYEASGSLLHGGSDEAQKLTGRIEYSGVLTADSGIQDDKLYVCFLGDGDGGGLH